MPFTPGQPTAVSPTYVQPTPVQATPVTPGQFHPVTLQDGAPGEWRCSNCNYLNVGTRSTTCLNCGNTMRDMVQMRDAAGEWRCSNCNYLNLGTRSNTCLSCGMTMKDMVQVDSQPVALLDGGYGVCKCDKCGYERPPAGNPCGYACPTGDGGTMVATRRL
jgi:hypothetical protein